MKLRDKILYMSFGAGLVVLGMMLNSLMSGDAEAQGGLKDGHFRYITCEALLITDGDKARGAFGLDDTGNAILKILDDDGKKILGYFGSNTFQNGEIILYLFSKSFSETDKRGVSMSIDRNGGGFICNNKMGENVVRLAVGNDGGGLVDLRDKFGYKK